MRAFPATASRSAALPLFVGAGIAGFGLGLLALAASMPQRPVPPLPLPEAATLQPAAAMTSIDTTPVRDWAPAFGSPAPEPAAVAPAPAPPPPPTIDRVIDDDPFVDLSEYRLQGLVFEDGGGFAMVESDEGVAVYRPGDFLPGGETVTQIEEDGIEIEFDGEYYFIGFEEDDDPFEDFDGPDDGGEPGGLSSGLPQSRGPSGRIGTQPSDQRLMGPVGVPPPAPSFMGVDVDR